MSIRAYLDKDVLYSYTLSDETESVAELRKSNSGGFFRHRHPNRQHITRRWDTRCHGSILWLILHEQSKSNGAGKKTTQCLISRPRSSQRFGRNPSSTMRCYEPLVQKMGKGAARRCKHCFEVVSRSFGIGIFFVLVTPQLGTVDVTGDDASPFSMRISTIA